MCVCKLVMCACFVHNMMSVRKARCAPVFVMLVRVMTDSKRAYVGDVCVCVLYAMLIIIYIYACNIIAYLCSDASTFVAPIEVCSQKIRSVR